MNTYVRERERGREGGGREREGGREGEREKEREREKWGRGCSMEKYLLMHTRKQNGP